MVNFLYRKLIGRPNDIVWGLFGFAVILFCLQDNDFAFSQTDSEGGLVPGSNDITSPTSPISNQSLEVSQELPGFVASGIINSVIDVPKGKWLAAGNWSMIVNNGNVTLFDTKMTWYNSSGTNAHTHDLTNFKAVSDKNQTLPVNITSKQTILQGVTDVSSNGKVSWYEVPTTVTINDKKIISISVDDAKTNHHFGGQPLLGIVDSYVPCSDQPGPNMQLQPPCSINPLEDISISEGLLPYQDPLSGQFPQEGFPDQGVSGGGFPTEDDQTGEGTEDDQTE
jgi:hypothetical protein